MKTVADLLRAKSHSLLFNIGPQATVLEAAALMAEKDVSALMVVEGDQLLGIITERDYVRRVAQLERSAYATLVEEVMTRKLITITPQDDVRHCMELMIDKKLRHLPVLDGVQLLGILSIRDLIRAVVHEQEHLIQHLEQYIRGDA